MLDLSRDLSQAIYEYAPDATIVAGGKLWTSRGIYRLPGRDLVEYQYHVCKRCGGFRHAFADVDPACQHCGEVAQTAPRKVTIPEFGFVAGREPEKPGPRPPQRSWSGAVHVLAEPPEVHAHTKSMAGGSIAVKVGPRGQMVAVADGPAGMGFWVCDWCGYGAARALHPQKPPKHNHLLTNHPCNGSSRLLDLAHVYETDLLTLDIGLPGFQGSQAAWKSVLYALVEAACEALEIARDDIGGSLTPIGADDWSVALFDTVSGGAGHVLLVEENLDLVLAAALRRVSTCECGPETSCYGCLRSYGNQRDHDELSRGAAEQILTRLLAGSGTIDPAVHAANVHVGHGWRRPRPVLGRAARRREHRGARLPAGARRSGHPPSGAGVRECRWHPDSAGLAGPAARCRPRARRRRPRRPEGRRLESRRAGSDAGQGGDAVVAQIVQRA